MKVNLAGQWHRAINWGGGTTANIKVDFSEPAKGREVFHLLLFRPTRYDDDGYPIQWHRSSLPSNSLACLHGIAIDAANRWCLGEQVEIRVAEFDEASEVVDYPRLIKSLKKAKQKSLVCLVGVQSNQFPRAMDIADPFLTASIPVCMGGFHVSGCLSMLDELPPELEDAQSKNVSLFAGEAEGQRFDRIVQDAWFDKLKPLYDYSKDMVNMEGQPLPEMTPDMVSRNLSNTSTIDLGRGCPFTCSFCCIINVQGRSSRTRSVEDLEMMVRRVHASGHTDVFITDDNFARNELWEAHFDRLIELRKEGIKLNLIIQVDTLCHKIEGFIDKAVEAGVSQVFVGLENINPDNLAAMKKRQNKITEYRNMLLQWKKHPVIIWGAYILGLPNDTRESILRDIDIIKKELPIDLFNPSIITPLPGSEDHKNMLARGEWMDPDFNNYDLAHRVIHHKTMTDSELDSVYIEAWDRYYTFDHMVTVLKRMFALGSNKKISTVERLIAFGVITRAYNIRSYDMGLMRRRLRKSRRPGAPIEPFFLFHIKNLYSTVRNLSITTFYYAKLYREMRKLYLSPNKTDYMDKAITPVEAVDELNNLELFKETRGGDDAVKKFKNHQKIREKIIAKSVG